MTGRRSRWLLRTAAAALVALTCGLPVAADSHPPPRASTPHVTATLLGEAGTIASTPAVINAIVDALRPMGINDITMPATPERVWKAINSSKGAAQ